LKEELYVYRVWRVLGDAVDLVLNEIVLGQHAHVGVVGVDSDRPTEGNCYGSVPGEEGPPNALP
jgi:hypothetical protein